MRDFSNDEWWKPFYDDHLADLLLENTLSNDILETVDFLAKTLNIIPGIYDKNGNTTTDSVGNTYTYDAFNNLITETYKSSGATTTYSYYGSSRVKIAESTGSIKQFIMAGGMASEEWDGATPVIAKRFYGQGVITYSGGVGTNYFYTRDHLGSIRELTNSSGNVSTRMDYDPYGVTTVVSGTVIPDFAYAGMYQHVPSGNYLSATRLYNPSLGRWLSRDPIQESGGLNMYAYCGNNPINAKDPGGLSPQYPGLLNLLPQGAPGSNAEVLYEAENTQSEPGYYIVAGHGNSSFAFTYNGLYVSPQTLANWIREQSDYKPGTPIRLESCQLGKYSGWYARKLAQILGVTVMAPNEYIYPDDFGDYAINADPHVQGGPGLNIAPTDATGKFISFPYIPPPSPTPLPLD